MDSLTLNSTTTSEKSFIQQRVERLYGPGALAQGFFFKRSNTKLNASDSFNKSNNNNNDIIITDNANTEESLKNLPVLRHLRPEFRAQLPVVSPRRPTDGSEQIIKPLQRYNNKIPCLLHLKHSLAPFSWCPMMTKSVVNCCTPREFQILSIRTVKCLFVNRRMRRFFRRLTQRKNESKVNNSNASVDLTEDSLNEENNTSASLSNSITNMPDQQPAAAQVVLPVLETSASSTSIPKQALETETATEEKDGHYFMKVRRNCATFYVIIFSSDLM